MKKGVLLASFLAAGVANAATISVNLHLNTNDANMVDAGEIAFNGVTGAESVAGANVNNISIVTPTSINATNLKDGSGGGSGVGFTTSASGFFTSFTNNSSPNQAATGNGGLGQSTLYFNTAETLTLTGLSGFAPGGYNLILLFDSSNEHGGRTYGFTVNDGGGAQSLFTVDSNARDLDINNDGLFELIAATGTTLGTATTDANFATYSGLTGDTLTITAAQPAARATLAGFQVVAVPEPTAAALLGLGGLALIMRRRK